MESSIGIDIKETLYKSAHCVNGYQDSDLWQYFEHLQGAVKDRNFINICAPVFT
jgi:hypothetical protein